MSDLDFPCTPLAMERLRRLPLFSGADYLALNPDVRQAGVDPHEHALGSGAREGRALFTRSRLARTLGETALGHLWETAAMGEGLAPTRGSPTATVLVNSGSDEITKEIARSLAADLEEQGARVAVRDEMSDVGVDTDGAVVVAPHEFFFLGRGPLWQTSDIVARAAFVNTISFDSPEAWRAMPLVLNGRAVLDVSAVSARLWSPALPAFHAVTRVSGRDRWLEPEDLGHPLLAAAPPAARSLAFDPEAWETRGIDVLFFGEDTARRGTFFTRNAPSLAPHSGFIYLQQGYTEDVDRRVSRRQHGRLAAHLRAHARITLDVGHDEFAMPDVARLRHGPMAAGSVVVCDMEPIDPTVRAGVHVFHEDFRHVGALVDWLLRDPEGQEAALRVRANAFAMLEAIAADAGRARRVADAVFSRP